MRLTRPIAALSLALPLGIIALPGSVRSAAGSTIHLSARTVSIGQSETLSVTARDNAGHPLKNVKGTVTVHYGTLAIHLSLPPTNASGTAHVVFTPPVYAPSGTAQVQVTLPTGHSPLTLHSAFRLKAPAGLRVAVKVVPAPVVAPRPAYLVVGAGLPNGHPGARAAVDAAVVFPRRTLHLNGTTDARGTLTLKISTSFVYRNEGVAVAIVVRDGNFIATSSTGFSIKHVAAARSSTASTPTSTPTITATTATSSPAPTDIPVPAATDTPTPIPTPTPFPTKAPLVIVIPPTPAPTTASPTSTPIIINAPAQSPSPTALPTSSPTPTSTPSPTPTSTATATPIPSPTATPPCSADNIPACQQMMLDILNTDRAHNGNVAPLSLNKTQSDGTGSCVGAIGHSKAMADSGSIWHDNENYPDASFPNDICINGPAGENVGAEPGTNIPHALANLDALMMQEPHDPTTCAQYINHACNTINPGYYSVGIGILVQGGQVWLTEDFIG